MVNENQICSKCEKTAHGSPGHIGKKHKRCSGRKSGESKANCGGWRSSTGFSLGKVRKLNEI